MLALTMGSLPMGKNGCLLHCRLRYFDPAAKRAGLPHGVAALLEQADDTTAVVSLVNSPTVLAMIAPASTHKTDCVLTALIRTAIKR